MTVDSFTPHNPQIVQGVGPYTASWPALHEDDVSVLIFTTSAAILLGKAAYSVGLQSNAVSVTLTAAAATLHANAKLMIVRSTLIEQGWAAQFGSREAALEAQLDRMTKGIQENKSAARRSLRFTQDMQPIQPVEGHTIVFDENGQALTVPLGSGGEAVGDGTFNLSIGTVQTVNFPAPANATLTGPSSNRRLNLTLPRGPEGASGSGAASIGFDFQYDTRALLAAAIAAGDVADGDVGVVGDYEAIWVIDSGATGLNSALHDLNQDGVRFSSPYVDARWFDIPASGDASMQMQAAVDHANAVRGQNNQQGVEFVFRGYFEISEQIHYNFTGPRAKVDTYASRCQVIAGGTLETSGNTGLNKTDPDGDHGMCAIKVSGPRSSMRLGEIDCAELCGGYEISTMPLSRCYLSRVNSIKFRGYWFKEGCDGSTFYDPNGFEYGPSHPNWSTDSAFDATGIYVECNDFSISGGGMNWCYMPVDLAPGSGVSFFNHHPANGKPDALEPGVGPRNHPFVVRNRSNSENIFNNCYLDNGYTDDQTGSLHLKDCWYLILGNRVTMTEPYVRIRVDDVLANRGVQKGHIVDTDVSVGFYTGAWENDFSNGITDNPVAATNHTGLGRVLSKYDKKTTLYNYASLAIQEHFIANGPATAEFVWRFTPGMGEDVDFTFHDGVLQLSRNGAQEDAGILQLYKDGDNSNVGSELRLKHNGDAGTSTVTVSSAGLFLNGSPIGGGAATGPFEIAAPNVRLLDANGDPQWVVNANGRFKPFADGQPFGSETERVRGLILQPRAVDGTAGTNTLEMFQAQNGGLRLGPAGDTASNLGQDVGAVVSFRDVNTTSGTIVWDRLYGAGIEVGPALTGAVTFDISDMKLTEIVVIYLRQPNSQTVAFTLPPTNTLKWAGGVAPTLETDSIEIVLRRNHVSDVIANWAEYS